MPNSIACKPFNVLVHTDKILIIQTNAGTQLTSTDQPDSATNCAKAQNNATKKVAIDSYGQFNLGLHVQDDPSQVLQNRAQLLGFMNDYLAEHNSPSYIQAIYWLNQIHSNQVITIDDCLINGGSLLPAAADALVSHKPHQALAIMTADCVPIVIYDPNSEQIATIHAGWQGLANGVIFETFKELNKRNSEGHTKSKNAKSIQAWIGACISKACYEVSKEVVDKLLFGCEKFGMDIDMVSEQIVGSHEDTNKVWLDLPKLAQLQLTQLGIETQPPAGNQASAPALTCSYSNPHYYSYRRKTHLGENHTGRMALLIAKLS